MILNIEARINERTLACSLIRTYTSRGNCEWQPVVDREIYSSVYWLLSWWSWFCARFYGRLDADDYANLIAKRAIHVSCSISHSHGKIYAIIIMPLWICIDMNLYSTISLMIKVSVSMIFNDCILLLFIANIHN